MRSYGGCLRIRVVARHHTVMGQSFIQWFDALIRHRSGYTNSVVHRLTPRGQVLNLGYSMPTAAEERVPHGLDIVPSRPAHAVVGQPRNPPAVAMRSHSRVVTSALSGVVHAGGDFAIPHTTEPRTRLGAALRTGTLCMVRVSVDDASTLLARIGNSLCTL